MIFAIVAGVNAQSWAGRWEWPLVPIRQEYNLATPTNDPKAADMEVGATGPYWLYPPYSQFNGVMNALRVDEPVVGVKKN